MSILSKQAHRCLFAMCSTVIYLGILVPGGTSSGRVGLVWLHEAHLHVRCCAQDVC